MSGFGRKGVGTAPAVDRSFGAPGLPAPRREPVGLSSQAQAFLAAERANRGAVAAAPVDPQTQALASAMAFKGNAVPEKSLVLAYVLWWFGGVVGAHRFYLGAVQSGAAMAGLLIGGLLMALAFAPLGGIMIVICFIWTLVDAFLIPGLRRRHAASQRTGEYSYSYG